MRRGSKRVWTFAAWLLIARKAPKLAAVALANKLARIAWKLMVRANATPHRRAPAETALVRP